MHDTSRTVQRIKSKCASQWYGVPRSFRWFLAFLPIAAMWWRAHILDLNDAHPGPLLRTGVVFWVTLIVWAFATRSKRK